MDISETYIKMCEQAKEIQLANQEFKTNKNIHQSSVVNCICIVLGDFFYLPEIYTQWFDKDAIWLPRQDQLQEMVIISADCIGGGLAGVLGDFYDFLRPVGISMEFIAGYCKQFTSMEQLWLAFVMKEKYGKVWDNKDWILSE